LLGFQYGTNVYQQSVYRDKENDIKAALTNLDSYSVSSHTTQPTKSSFLQAKYVVPAVLLAVGLVAVIGIVIRNKKKTKVKK